MWFSLNYFRTNAGLGEWNGTESALGCGRFGGPFQFYFEGERKDMAFKGGRISFGGSLSMRESLGMPQRREDVQGRPTHHWEAGASGKKKKQQQQQQQNRRKTYVTKPSLGMKASLGRPSAGRCVPHSTLWLCSFALPCQPNPT